MDNESAVDLEMRSVRHAGSAAGGSGSAFRNTPTKSGNTLPKSGTQKNNKKIWIFILMINLIAKKFCFFFFQPKVIEDLIQPMQDWMIIQMTICVRICLRLSPQTIPLLLLPQQHYPHHRRKQTASGQG